MPLLTRAGYKWPIHATPATIDVADLILSDSAHLLQSDVERQNRRRAREGRPLLTPLYVQDDMGMKQLPKRSGEFLFEIIMRRHELRSTIMTSNRPLEDWGKLIGDVPAATAILDRFLQDAELIQITGKSYRLRGRAADTSPGQNAMEPAKPESAKPATEESKTGQTRAPGRQKTSTSTTGR